MVSSIPSNPLFSVPLSELAAVIKMPSLWANLASWIMFAIKATDFHRSLWPSGCK